MALSVHLVGYDVFYIALCMLYYEELGLTVDPLGRHCLMLKQIARENHLAKSQTSAHKKKRRESTFKKLQVYYAKLMANTAKRKAYKSGSAMESLTETVVEPEDTEGSTIVRCKRCSGIGHKTANSKLCVFYRQRSVIICEHES
jgi:hypothetical protein